MPDHDDRLTTDNREPDAQGLSELYSQTRNAPLDTTALDDKILAAAHEELAEAQGESSNAPSNIVKLSGWRRWSPPIASAACVLLGVSLVLNIVLYQQTENPLPTEALQVPVAHYQSSESALAPDMKAQQPVNEGFSLQSAAAPEANKSDLQGESDDNLRARTPKAVSAAEADKIFQGFEEITVTGSRVQEKAPLSPELQSRVNKIIELLQNGQLADARQQLGLLIEEYPELVDP